MSEEKNHIEPLKELSPQLMEAYATGTLSPAAQHQVEKYLLDHPFEAEAMEGYLEQNAAFEDLSGLDKKLQERIRTSEENIKIIPVWRKALPYAAVFLLLIMATIIATVLISQQEELNPISLQKEDVFPLDKETKTIKPPFQTQKEGEEEVLEASEPYSDNNMQKEVPVDQFASEPVMEALTAKEPQDSFEDEISQPELALDKDISQQLQGKVAGVKIQAPKEETNTQTLTSYASAKEVSIRGYSTRAKKASSEIKVKGKVTDAETGEALPGVNVLVKNSSVGVNTNLEGNFQIEVAPDDILVVSFIGMEKEEVAVAARSEIEISLNSDVAQLSEVVVTGYGTQNEIDVTYRPASPVGGFSDFKDYIENNLRYPEEAIDNKTEGKVVLKVTISSTGSISNIEVIKSLGSGCDEEAIRLIKEGPAWEPAKRGDLSVESAKRIRIKFAL